MNELPVKSHTRHADARPVIPANAGIQSINPVKSSGCQQEEGT